LGSLGCFFCSLVQIAKGRKGLGTDISQAMPHLGWTMYYNIYTRVAYNIPLT
jgi:hypothetical protein